MLKSNLKELLYVRRMTIREFSRRVDFRFETVRQLYNNEILRIPTELIEKTCVELNCTPGELFSIVPDDSPEGIKIAEVRRKNNQQKQKRKQAKGATNNG